MKTAKKTIKNHLEIYTAETSDDLDLSYIESGISAGFPSPANDFLDLSIDLNKVLIKNPSATFYGRVKGNSMINAGINDGDLLVIDKSMEPKNGKIAVCFIDGEFTIKRIKIEKGNCKGRGSINSCFFEKFQRITIRPIKLEQNLPPQ